MGKMAVTKMIAALTTALAVFAIPVQAFACTAVYVGSDVSSDGSTIIAKSNDYQAVWANYILVTDRVENVPGRTMQVDNEAKSLAKLPATTYHYTATPMMDSALAINKQARDATVCSNECGVAMEMSITAFSNDAALAADPLLDTGLTEFAADDLVVCQSDTARKGVEVLASILDEFGSSEVNIAFISDQTETWYVEIYTGHQYAAVKLPKDKVCVFGNEFTLEYLSDYEDSIVSPNLESLAKDNGFAVYGENGELNLYKTYSGDAIRTNYSHMRTWIGHTLLSSAFEKSYNKDDFYPLVFNPDGKVSLQDVMEIIRNRFEGTEYSPDETGRTDMRVIGTDTALSVHIAQVYPNLPAEMSCVTWESTGPAIYGVFVPVSNASLSVSEPYSLNQSADEAGIFDTDTYPYYRFKELNTLVVEPSTYKTYGIPVRAYWHEAETGMIDGMAKVLENAASMDIAQAKQYITDYCNTMQQQAFDDSGKLLNDVIFYMAANSNTMKNGRNPETGEIIDQMRTLEPLKVTLDSSPYYAVPDIAVSEDSNNDITFVPFLTTMAVIVLVGIIRACVAKRLDKNKKNID
ncbi:MAG: C69 family dipeptidase [Parasporobacterium sp.]|nr:C69 family dipeptidase [Parasporobacterium sp.]